MKTEKNTKMKPTYDKKYKYKERMCYLMLAPQILNWCIFSIVPLVWAISLSWTNYDTITSSFVGWTNFKALFGDTSYWRSLLTTFQFAFMKMPIELPLALILAALLSRKTVKGKGLFRAIYYLPNVVSVALMALVFSNLFGYFGVINGILQKWGIIDLPIEWFATKGKAMWVLVITDIWKTFGVNVLYFVAALANVPEELYESARLDGASRVRQFFSVTIPLIAPTLQIILMLSIIGTLGVSELVYVMTNGAPGGSTFTVQAYIFANYAPGIVSNTVNVGYGCAMSLVTGLILTTITLTYMKLSAKVNDIY